MDRTIPLVHQEGPAPEPLTRRSVVEELARRIQERIQREALAPGERLGTKAELARQYRVSAGTVNSAIRLLDAAGVAAARPGVGGGVFVSPAQPRVQLGRALLTLRESSDEVIAQDAYQSRALLEVLLARLAARFRTDEDIHELESTLARLQATQGDITLYMRANWALHDCIAQAAHDETLLAVYRGLVEVVIADIAHIGDRHGAPRGDGANARLHERLVESIIQGDVEEATRAAEAHAQRILSTLQARRQLV